MQLHQGQSRLLGKGDKWKKTAITIMYLPSDFPSCPILVSMVALKKTKKMKYAQKHLPSLAATCTNV